MIDSIVYYVSPRATRGPELLFLEKMIPIPSGQGQITVVESEENLCGALSIKRWGVVGGREVFAQAKKG